MRAVRLACRLSVVLITALTVGCAAMAKPGAPPTKSQQQYAAVKNSVEATTSAIAAASASLKATSAALPANDPNKETLAKEAATLDQAYGWMQYVDAWVNLVGPLFTPLPTLPAPPSTQPSP